MRKKPVHNKTTSARAAEASLPTGAAPDDSPTPRAASAATKRHRGTKREKDSIERSFSFPLAEYHALVSLKTRLEQLSRPVKKVELLRAGIGLLASLSDDELQAVVSKVAAPAKGGRAKRPAKRE